MTAAPKICVAGVGALGGGLAVRLARTDACLSVVARGETLRRIQADGLVLDDAEGTFRTHPAADCRAPNEPQDVIILAAKSHQLPSLAEAVAHAVGPQTTIIPVINGIPWWLTVGAGSPLAPARDLLDPDGILAQFFPVSQVVGCVAYAFASVVAPGHVRAQRAPLLLLGDPGRHPAIPQRVLDAVTVFRDSGIGTRLCPDIAGEIWSKLAANLATNPLSVVCEATMTDLAADGGTCALIRDMLHEVMAVGAAYGITPKQDVDAFLQVIVGAGSHRTSMLQDYDAGRSLELPAIGDALLALGAARSIPTPMATALVRLAAFKAARKAWSR
ncbi:2-dehydropantoate 2-reductase [Nguyenibacter vanlangensis]|uniref:2-dehydropantoate 2-reductase n=1 Tax=Nguyenibacter vanlangensis TaxID=1216886 RepID=A0ABZ3DA76_9PROT